jgi:hypothetical protein
VFQAAGEAGRTLYKSRQLTTGLPVDPRWRIVIKTGSMDDNDERKLEIDVLLKELDQRFSGLMFHTQRYHGHVEYIQLYVTVTLGLVALLSSNKIQGLADSAPALRSLRIGTGLLLFFAAIITFFLATTVLEAVFMIYLNRTRIAAVEKMINARTKQGLLVWELEITPHFVGSRSNGWHNPNVFVTSWACLFSCF